MQALYRTFGGSLPDVTDAASERWVIAPASRRHVPPATFLPGQLDRLRGAAFGTVPEVVRSLRGAFDTLEPETMGYRLSGADLIDGVLYAKGSVRNLRRRHRRLPAYRRPTELARGALYESWVGNRWFGNWLSDDCLTYALATQFGVPVTTSTAATGHRAVYAAMLEMTAAPVARVHFEELILFGDSSHNIGKAARADGARRRLTEHLPDGPAHPGVFLLRGASGERRMLVNEAAIAEALVLHRGFTVIDPASASVDRIVAACAHARVVIGVEGSHLVHGLMVMPPKATLLTLQPPDRVVSVLKMITDRQDQRFAFVIGTGSTDAFEVPWGEIERTLDMALN